MTIRLEKPWRPASEADQLAGHLGVFQLAGADGTVVFIGFAGARDLFGLGGAVSEAFEKVPAAKQFRVEITSAYWTRYQELLMIHEADFGVLPQSDERPRRLGRLSPG